MLWLSVCFLVDLRRMHALHMRFGGTMGCSRRRSRLCVWRNGVVCVEAPKCTSFFVGIGITTRNRRGGARRITAPVCALCVLRTTSSSMCAVKVVTVRVSNQPSRNFKKQPGQIDILSIGDALKWYRFLNKVRS